MIKGSRIGAGAYGIVYTATSPGKTEYVVKRNLITDDISFHGSIRELDMLAYLSEINPYVVHLRDVIFGPPFKKEILSPLEGEKGYETSVDDNIHFIFERANRDFDDEIRDPAENKNFLANAKKYMLQLLIGLEIMHRNKIMHRDIKPCNILIFGSGNEKYVKYCDFGISKYYSYQDPNTNRVMTVTFRAPEIVMKSYYDYKADIWSLGCVFFEMIAKKSFIMEENAPDRLIAQILRKIPEEFNVREKRELTAKMKEQKIYPDLRKITCGKSFTHQLGLTEKGINEFERYIGNFKDFCDLLNNMIKFDDAKRFSAQRCLEHKFLTIDEPEGSKEIYDNYMTDIKTVSNELPMQMIACNERTWMKEIILSIFHDQKNHSWYSHRIIFHIISFFDAFLYATNEKNKKKNKPSEDMGTFFTREKAQLYLVSIMYMFIKFFSTTYTNINYDDLIDDSLNTPENKLLVLKFEERLLKNNKYRIYHDTLFEAADKFDLRLNDNQVHFLLSNYFDNGDIIGLLPSVALAKLYKQNEKLEAQPLSATSGDSDIVVEHDDQSIDE